MKVKITRVEDKLLDEYKGVLDKFNASYFGEEHSHYAIIEVETLDQLFDLAKELKLDLIIDKYSRKENKIIIYDDYLS